MSSDTPRTDAAHGFFDMDTAVDAEEMAKLKRELIERERQCEMFSKYVEEAHREVVAYQWLLSKVNPSAWDALKDENAALRAALIAVRDWYDRDGSVGGCDVVMDEVNEVINKLIINQ